MMKIKYYDVNKFILYLCFITIGFDGFYFYGLSFAIKPYMLIILLAIPIMLNNRNISQLNRTERLMLVFFLCYGFLCIRIENINLGVRYLAGIFVVLLLYFSLREIFNSCSIKDIENVMENCGIIISFCSLTYYIWGLRNVGFNFAISNRMRVKGVLFERGVPRLFGTLNQDPNFAAMMLMLYFFYYFFHLNKKKNYMGLFMSALCIVLTFSRTAFFSIIIAIFTTFIITKHARLKLDRSGIRNIIIIITLGIVFVIILIQGNIKFDIYNIFMRRIGNIRSDGGSGRFELWKYGLQGWLEKPFIGHGGNQTKQYMKMVYGVEKELHNTWLEVLFESGILGISFLIYWMVSIWHGVLRVAKAKQIYICATIVGMAIMLASVSGLFNENNYLLLALVYKYSREYKLLHGDSVKGFMSNYAIEKQMNVGVGRHF